MARKTRIEFEGGFYHVIARGNQRQKIFLQKEDFLKYLEFLGDYKDRYRFFLFAYVLMENHVHLLVETGETPLSKILQGVNQRYTMYFNRRYQTVGHLFQGRYKAILCDRDEYLLTLVKYLHYNPVRAGVVKWPEQYSWSSHRQYIGLNKDGAVDTIPVLKMFSEDLSRARRFYRKYMGEEVTISKDDLYKTVDQRILGGKKFVERVMGKVPKGIVPGKRRHGFSLGEIAKGIRQIYGITLKELRGKGKDLGVMEGRKLMSLAAREYGYKGREVAEFLRKDPAAVARYIRDKDSFYDKMDKLFLTLEDTEQNVNNQV